ncbi:hypothetical protein AAFC00_004946 [Neodothiora populina]|uniref:Smr domain-containing protein n=1 Tax=Neodothiora populina TaxID=2781224 RepID=A0ABR3P3V7_9PEZI
MSHAPTRIGGSAFNHSQSADAEAAYDRLRDQARSEQSQHQHYAAEARKAYERGDGATAHEMSTKSKQYAAKADEYNKQASDYIFRENNAVGRVDGDTIDLHGQFVEEAEEIVTQRIKYAQQTGQSHLHVIVGKGNHSANHIQKIKPAVENICKDLGLNYHTEQNEGRIYVDLTGGQARPPTNYGGAPQNYDQQQYGQPQYQTAYPLGGNPQYGGQQQQHHQQQQGPQEHFDYAGEAKKYMPLAKKIFYLLKSCFR